MAKIKTIQKIDIRTKTQVASIEADTYIEVTEEMAIFLCNEDIAQLSLEEQRRNSRSKKAIRTPVDEQINTHVDYTRL